MLKQYCEAYDAVVPEPAAFGRLCVETLKERIENQQNHQPPSGGCVLKLIGIIYHVKTKIQPPSGGCVLKRVVWLCL